MNESVTQNHVRLRDTEPEVNQRGQSLSAEWEVAVSHIDGREGPTLAEILPCFP